MTAAPTDQDLRALQHLVCAIRTDWHAQGVHAALRAARDAAHGLDAIAVAAIDAANSPNTRTPAGIGARLRGTYQQPHKGAKADDVPHYYRSSLCPGCSKPGPARGGICSDCRPTPDGPFEFTAKGPWSQNFTARDEWIKDR